MIRFPLTLEEWNLKKELVKNAFRSGWTIQGPQGRFFDSFNDISQTAEGEIELLFHGHPGMRHILTKEEWEEIEALPEKL